MSKDNKRLMMEQFQGKKPDEWVDYLIKPINNLIDTTSRLDTKGVKLEDGIGVVFKEFTLDVPSDWLEIGQSGAPAFQNNWQNYGGGWLETLAIRKDHFGVVRMRGFIKAGTIGTTVFTLPDAYRPPVNAGIHFATASNGAYGQIKVWADPADPARLGAVEAQIGNNAYFSMRADWEASDRSPIIPACFPYNFKVPMPRVGLVQIVQVLDSSNNPVATGPLSVDFQHLKDGRVSIRNIPGLKPSTSYKITVAVFPR